MCTKPVCVTKERARTPSLCLYRSKALVKPIPRSTSARSPAYNPIRICILGRKTRLVCIIHSLIHILSDRYPLIAGHYVIEMSRANLCGRSTNFHTIKLRRRPANWEYREYAGTSLSSSNPTAGGRGRLITELSFFVSRRYASGHLNCVYAARKRLLSPSPTQANSVLHYPLLAIPQVLRLHILS